MKLNYFAKRFSTIGRWMATAFLGLLAMTFVWQGAFFSTPAVAAPLPNLLATDTGRQAKE